MYCKESVEEPGKYACYPATDPEQMIPCAASMSRPDLDWYGGWDVKHFDPRYITGAPALPNCASEHESSAEMVKIDVVPD
jgi:hypothetical protein